MATLSTSSHPPPYLSPPLPPSIKVVTDLQLVRWVRGGENGSSAAINIQRALSSLGLSSSLHKATDSCGCHVKCCHHLCHWSRSWPSRARIGEEQCTIGPPHHAVPLSSPPIRVARYHSHYHINAHLSHRHLLLLLLTVAVLLWESEPLVVWFIVGREGQRHSVVGLGVRCRLPTKGTSSLYRVAQQLQLRNQCDKETA